MRILLFGCIVSLLLFISLPHAVSENSYPVQIGEVQMNPDASDTGAEFVELVNVTNEPQVIGGWDIDAADLPYFTIPAGTQIPSQGVLVIYFRKDGINNADTIFTGAAFGSTNMKNTNGGVALFSSQSHTASTLMDYVAYGASAQIHETIAIEKGLWQTSLYIPVAGTEGWSMMRTCQRKKDLACWNYGIATPGTHSLQDFVQLSPAENMNQNTSTGTLFYTVKTYINDNPFTEDLFISEEPVKLRLEASSGTTLHLNAGNGFEDVIPAYERIFDEEGTYAVTYFINNDESSAKNVTISYYKPAVPVYPALNEVSFNASDGKKDFIELYFPPDTTFSNLQDFSLLIDQTSISLKDAPISSDGYVLLSFGAARTEVDVMEQKIISNPSSLVSTTEQITLLYKGQSVDGVCWETLPIPSTEVTDYEKFTGGNGIWNSTCIQAQTAGSSQSIIRKEKGTYPTEKLSKILWDTLSLETPGTANIIPSSSPVADIQIQGDGKASGMTPFHLNVTGEGSSDAYGIESYLWDFGDGITSGEENPLDHVYGTIGNYNLTLTVTNIFGYSSVKTIQIQVLPASTGASGTTAQTTVSNNCTSLNETKVILSEIFPNPKGSDTNAEWIELYNPLDEKIIFCDLLLDDEEGGSLAFSLKGKSIDQKSYLVLPDTETKIILGNTTDRVRLLYGPEKDLIDSVSYKDAMEGMSYSRF